MGTTVTLKVRAVEPLRASAAAALELERRWFVDMEAALSRFRPDSALSRLNCSGSQWRPVPEPLFRALEAALWAWEATGGLVNPAILPALERYGYDRDHALLERAPAPAAAAPAPDRGTAVPAVPGFRLEPTTRSASLLPGVRVDLGGVVKGLAADISARRLARRFGYALADAGGDVSVWTPSSGGAATPWYVAVEPEEGDGAACVPDHSSPSDPARDKRPLLMVGLRRGGIATSSTGRRWVGALGEAHHLIDPRTGAPACSGVRAATAAARSALRAEVLAKAVVIGGLGVVPFLLGRFPEASVLAVTDGGTRFRTGVFARAR